MSATVSVSAPPPAASLNGKLRFRDKLRKGFHGVRDSLFRRGKGNVGEGAEEGLRDVGSGSGGDVERLAFGAPLGNGGSSARPSGTDDAPTVASLNDVNHDPAASDAPPVDPNPPSTSNTSPAPPQDPPDPTPPTSNAEPNPTPPPSPIPPPSTTPKDRLNTVLTVLSQVLNAATAATAVFPPAQALLGGMASGVGMAKSMVQNQLDREAVERNLKEAQRRIGRCIEMASVSEEMAGMLLDLERDLREDIGAIDDAMHERWWRRLVEGDAQEVVRHYGRLSARLGVFNTQTVVSTNANVEALKKVTGDLKAVTMRSAKAISEIQADVKFQALGRVPKAEYNAGPHDLRRACTPNTRTQILADLMTWATDDTSPNVHWLTGKAGSGKTTIAYSFCEALRAAHLLAASYFCSRGVFESRDPRGVLPSIAHARALHEPSFSHALLDALRDPDNASIREKGVEDQFGALIMVGGPGGSGGAECVGVGDVRKRKGKSRVVVWDGVDEMRDLKEVAELVGLFVKHAGELPFKVFISSRGEDILRSAFERSTFPPSPPSTTHSPPSSLILHSIDHTLVQADIRTYISQRLGHLPASALPPGAVDTLVERAGGLFVYAAVLCSFLDCGSAGRVRRRLRAVLDEDGVPASGMGGTRVRPYDALDRAYAQILSSSGVEGGAEGEENNNPDTWPVLLVLLTAPHPLSASSISRILGWEGEGEGGEGEERVGDVVRGLHAVLAGSDSAGQPITIFHSSFRDFLQDTSRGGKFCALISEHHGVLLGRSLQVMKGGLRVDGMCKGATKDTPRDSVAEPPRVSDELAYACMSWIEHLLGLSAEQVTAHEKKLRFFFDRLVLRWVECLAWMGRLREGVGLLRRADLVGSIPSEFALAFMDTRRFILQSFEAIRDFPLETYHSALAWLPQTSRIRRLFHSSVSHSEPHKADWRITRGLPVSWDACESVLAGHVDRVHAVDVSRDGRWVVSGSDDGTVRVWNVETGEEERVFVRRGGDGDREPVLCVCFSPDARARRVVFGLDDGTLRMWEWNRDRNRDRETGHEEGEGERKLGAHLDSVRCVAFSSDGRRVVSGSEDKTVRVWNVDQEKGVEETRFEGHAGVVWSVSFSPDGRQVVSGSSDQTVRIWDLETGWEELQIQGHSHSVHSVSFSPEGTRIASASADNTVRIWDAETGEEEKKLEGHSDWVQAVSFSSDGRRVVSGSDDTTVRVWDVETGAEERRLRGHAAWVRAVVFSSDGRRVVSGSRDMTVRIWNIEIGQDKEKDEEKAEGHVHPVQSVSLSPDGKRAVSGSRDNTVRIWNVETGKEEMVLEGHSDWVQSVAFSPDGRRVVSGSHDQTVRIWNVDSDTGKFEEKTLEGHSDTVWSVCFSSDGQRVVSGSDDGTARIWDVETGEEEKRLDLGGHSYLMRSLSFSPDGKMVVSLSRTRKVRKTWNIESGEEEKGNGVLTPAGEAALDSIAIKEGSLRSRSSQLWIPPEFRKYSCVVTSSNAVCLGYGDGRVLIARYIGV